MDTANFADENELDSLANRIAHTAALIDSAMHAFLTDLRRFDACEGWHGQAR